MATQRDGSNVTVTIPDILMAHARKEIERRKGALAAAYSMGDLVRDALRGMLTPDSAERPVGHISKDAVAMNVAVVNSPKLSAQELGVKFGIKTGATIEEVEPRLDPDVKYQAPPPGLPPKHIIAADDDEEGYYRNLINTEFGPKVLAEAWRTHRGILSRLKTSKKIYEWLKERKEMEGGG